MISYHHASKLSILILLSEVLKQEFERKIKEIREFIPYTYRLEYLTII